MDMTFCVLAQAAVTDSHTLGGLNSNHFSLTVLEAGNPRSGASLVGLLMRVLFLAC